MSGGGRRRSGVLVAIKALQRLHLQPGGSSTIGTLPGSVPGATTPSSSLSSAGLGIARRFATVVSEQANPKV